MKRLRGCPGAMGGRTSNTAAAGVLQQPVGGPDPAAVGGAGHASHAQRLVQQADAALVGGLSPGRPPGCLQDRSPPRGHRPGLGGAAARSWWTSPGPPLRSRAIMPLFQAYQPKIGIHISSRFSTMQGQRVRVMAISTSSMLWCLARDQTAACGQALAPAHLDAGAHERAERPEHAARPDLDRQNGEASRAEHQGQATEAQPDG